MMFTRKKTEACSRRRRPAGRARPSPPPNPFVNGHASKAPTRKASRRRSSRWAVIGAPSANSGVPGVWVTAVGNAGGTTPNPTYEESAPA